MRPLINQAIMDAMHKNQEQPIFLTGNKGLDHSKRDRFFRC